MGDCHSAHLLVVDVVRGDIDSNAVGRDCCIETQFGVPVVLSTW